ncbi:MAG TPA: metalloregulator ArsR/SmtB family transcription factor [Candidatus Limnocylindria bacterium]
MEGVFRALADPNRRALLDALHERDGRSLGELEEIVPGMTRFGVMKHLRVLADAGLVTTRRDGRRKLHYLNPVPIQLIADRWISRFAASWTAGLADLKATLEAPGPMTAPKHVYEVYIRTTPERLWQALTDPDLTQRYYHHTRVASGWKAGDPITYTWTDGTITIEGQIVEAEAPRRLVHTFHFTQDAEQVAERPSRCTWEIEPMGEACLLRLTHDDFDGETSTYRSVGKGWSPILSSLKTLLETGEPLDIDIPEPAGAAS